MEQYKIWIISSCAVCPACDHDGRTMMCNEKTRVINRNERFVIEDGEVIANKFPDWCPLKNC